MGWMLWHQTISDHKKCVSCGYTLKINKEINMANEVISLMNYYTSNGSHPERYSSPELNDKLKNNALNLMQKVNRFLNQIGITEAKVNSGFRTTGNNSKTKGAAPNSNHCQCLAIDINDPDGSLWNKCMENLQIAKDEGIWFEHKWWTSSEENGGWIHMQGIPPKSGNRIYIPSTNPPLSKKWWDGIYDLKYN